MAKFQKNKGKIEENNSKKILICGNYGAQNLGDESILMALISEFKKFKSISVLSYNPKQTNSLHNIPANYFLPFGFRSLIRGIFKLEFFKTLSSFKKCDIFILGGGGLFTDEKIKAIFIWSLHVFIAHILGKEVWIYRNSIGPLNTKIGRFITTKCLSWAKKITLRDQGSVNLAKTLLNKETSTSKVILKTQDAVIHYGERNKLFLNKNFSQKQNSGLKKPSSSTIILSLRPWINNQSKILSIIPPILDNLIKERGVKVLFIPFQTLKDDDQLLFEEIRQRMKNKDQISLHPIFFDLSNPNSGLTSFQKEFNQLISLFQSAELVIGMRLHSLIFAYLSKTPLIGLIYSSKVQGFLASINQINKGIKLKELNQKKIQEIINV